MPFYENVILGGGLVAGHAAQAFVDEGLEEGQLAIISAESRPPYDRPPLSKSFLRGEAIFEDLLINEPQFYREHGIETYLANPAVQADLTDRQLLLEDGTQITFDQLLIATGSKLRHFDLPGHDLDNILYLRDYQDARQIRRLAGAAERAVVIGGSFIGMEVASVLCYHGLRTTMVFPEDRVWQAFFTPTMSTFFEEYYRRQGVEFLTGAEVEGFSGKGKVQLVQVSQAERQINVPADLVVAGIGVTPNVDLFVDSELDTDEGILVDRFLETPLEGIFAAGDVARYPDQIFDQFRHVEHWDNAVTQGQHVARVMSGQREPFVHVPYFFSDVFDLSYEFWGDASQAEVSVHRGDIENGSFSVWWLVNDRLQAAFVMDRLDEEREFAPEWIKGQQPISAEALADMDRPLTDAISTPMPV
jgi:NADPH-dependent 2,4-dienoyl-CoA reductase/sulfur reductase-like enzyme